MNINVKQLKKSDLELNHSYILIVKGRASLSGNALKFWQKSGFDFAAIKQSENFNGKNGELIDIIAPQNIKANRIIIFGFEPDEKQKYFSFMRLGGIIGRKISSIKTNKISIIFTDESDEEIALIGAGIKLNIYKFDKYMSKKEQDKNKKTDKEPIINFLVKNKKGAQEAVEKRQNLVSGILLARDLINEPANMLGPEEFSNIALKLTDLGVRVEVFAKEQIEKLGMGAFLAVAKGSERPAKMLVLHYNGDKENDNLIALAGKGVMFDSGGISLKPANSMQDMKADMGGAAAILGLMKVLALNKVKNNVVAIIGLCENMPDGKAYRPGDIIKTLSGQTIEVISTDAEGRLVLADILWYAQKRFKPRILIDLATLTGAIMVGLGQEFAGLFTNDKILADKLMEAGEKYNEKLWPMPLHPAYDKLIDSKFADMKNTGGRYGGACTAAQFLARFIKDVRWAHIDIAGVGFAVKQNEINNSWAPGFGVALLSEYLQNFAD